MNNWKTKVRSWFRPETRGQFYAASAGVVTLLASLGLISVSIVPAITGVVLAALALVYAFVNSDSTKNKAIYTLCAAIGALLISLGYITGDQNQAVLAVVAPVLGVAYAAAKTPLDEKNAVNSVTISGDGPDPSKGTWVPHS